ncbi:AraC family transcriptional regulator [Vibrio paucivorans]|uniref:AraC family transcriptional regulator n=1 Tax=Vibrio paucivorans TaxID=2829489 RepID=A0A9X3HTA8_9VIBR|nr:AraC family transcriptional regulator [Vibrio paucivorans]MCW8335695.1 AraC family transcriptional regulator [Vibrio paucivorans]
MNYAIEHQYEQFNYLITTPRKKVIKYSLVRVIHGLVLVRLGKHEYTVEAGEAMWIPFDCLCSLSFFPGSKVQQVHFSARLTDSFPSQAGYVELNDLTVALLDRLATKTSSVEHSQDMLTVVRNEIGTLKPLLSLNLLSQAISSWQPDSDSSLARDVLMVLTVREAKKRIQSGQKKAVVIEQLFAGNAEECEQIALLVLGEDF